MDQPPTSSPTSNPPPLPNSSLPPVLTLPPPKPSPLKKLLLALILLLAIVSVVAAAYLFYQNQQLQKQIDQPAPTAQSDNQTQLASTNHNQTSDWETYTDSQLGISFQHPSDIYVSDQVIGDPYKGGIQIGKLITISPYENRLSSEWYQQNPQAIQPNNEIPHVIIDGKEYAFTKSNWEDGGNNQGTQQLTYFIDIPEKISIDLKYQKITHPDNSNLDYLQITAPNGTPIKIDSSEIDTAIQILSTFKFSSNPGQEHSNYSSKYLIDPYQKFMGDVGYPVEVANFTDAQLIGLTCSSDYIQSEQGKYVSNPTETNPNPIPLTDKLLIGYTQKIGNISVISKCVTDESETIVHYEIHSGGGGSNNKAFFVKIDSQGKEIGQAQINTDGIGYFTCQTPYLLSALHQLYWECGGGDGGFASKSIYNIDLNNFSTRRVLKCTETADSSFENPTGTSTVNCEGWDPGGTQ